MLRKVINKNGVEIQVGDSLLIKDNRLGSKLLANVEKGEVIVITSISDDGKILYHHNSLAIPADCCIFDIIPCANKSM